ncbi:hypothetical protein FB451DRAFT_1102497 [Mycena latifolia]|nr:hypothetical protein FB451DRAFT_1102497 [Mycena latifolia]
MTRRSTVYDFSGLNLHPDGSRPGEASDPWRRAHLDPRGNWVVQDASRVLKFYTVPDIDNEEQEEFDFTGVNTGAGPSSSSRKGKEKELTPESDTEGRRAKRRKVAHNFDFLETTVPHAPSAPSAFAAPSSDLLKCIHHFACNYYSDRGQLFNDSRTYLKEKKQRRLAKLARLEKAQDPDADSEEEEADVSVLKTKNKNKTAYKKNETRRRDMYKRMDGSALLAIGMLLQEHVARILSPRIPDGWEQSILERPEDEEDEDDGDGEDGEDDSGERRDDGPHDGDENEDDEDEDEDEDEVRDVLRDDGKDPDSDDSGSRHNLDDAQEGSDSRETDRPESDSDED